MARLTPLVDATNVTLTWERPLGRIDMYRLVWYQSETESASSSSSSGSAGSSGSRNKGSGPQRTKRQLDSFTKRSVVVSGDSNHSYIDTLFPGTLYMVEMTSLSFGVESNHTTLTLRTCNSFHSYSFQQINAQLNELPSMPPFQGIQLSLFIYF